MPVYRSEPSGPRQLRPEPFSNERELQNYFEQNLEALLSIRFVAREYVTGPKHGGRIDTLGLDEAANPVIIEYKWDKSESIINQGLFYLDWLIDHRGDFAVAVQQAFKKDTPISWNNPRLIVVASSYTKYDTYAVNRLGVSVQLIRYARYEGGILHLESVNDPIVTTPGKPKVVASPAADAASEYDLDYHFAKATPEAVSAFKELREQILGLEGVTEHANQKSQVSYRTTKSFAAFDFGKKAIRVQLKGGEEVNDPDSRLKDIKSYQWGYPWMAELHEPSEVPAIFDLVKQAYLFEQ